jgi:hypothetical protein
MGADAAAGLRADAGVMRLWAGRVPILIGACGHRNIGVSYARLTGALKAQCAELKRNYRHSPFVILSALAEGADRLTAKIAMAELQAELIAVLPMPAEDYERDFPAAESKAEFRALLDRALFIKTAEVPAGGDWKKDGEPRNVQYARAGAIIVDHAQVLFAIWDGKPARGTGGTADQVEWFERGYSPKAYTAYKGQVTPLDPQEPGRSIRIDPQSGAVFAVENPASVARVKKVREPQKSQIERILHRTDDFNHAVQTGAAAIAKSYPLAGKESIRELDLTRAVYHAADGVSGRFAKTVRGFDSLIYVLALLAVIVFNFVSTKPWAPWTYLGITFVMLLAGLRILAAALDNRFLEYRCFAEGLRTLFFWRAAGVKRSVWLQFLSRQSGAVHWIRQSVRTVEFCQDRQPCSHPGLESVSQSEGLRIAKEEWVDGQAKWFADKAQYHLRRYRIWNNWGRIAIAGSFLTAMAIAATTLIDAPGSEKTLFAEYVQPDTYTDFWQLALSLCAAGAVAARGFILRTAHLEIANQYASQRQIFEQASAMLEALKNDRAAEWTSEEILEKLGQEALQEQAEWVWLRHTRPFEVPAG